MSSAMSKIAEYQVASVVRMYHSADAGCPAALDPRMNCPTLLPHGKTLGLRQTRREIRGFKGKPLVETSKRELRALRHVR